LQPLKSARKLLKPLANSSPSFFLFYLLNDIAMTEETLRKRRLACPNIPTDSQGNLIVPHNPNRVSGTEQRKIADAGTYYKKDHSGETKNQLGTYRLYNFGEPMPEDGNPDESADQ
jgi:hypothetical protein